MLFNKNNSFYKNDIHLVLLRYSSNFVAIISATKHYSYHLLTSVRLKD